MKKTLTILALGALLAPAAARAQFEGVVEMKITGNETTGTGRFYASRTAARSEIEMTVPASSKKAAMMGDGPLRMTMLMKFAQPDLMWMINDARKVYSEMDLKKMREMGAKYGKGSGSDEAWTVKRLGPDSVAGYSCEKVLVSSGRSMESEMCVAKDIAGLSALAARMNREQNHEGMYKALKDAGIEGFPVRTIVREKGGRETMRMEVVKAERKSLPGSLFEIPPGYQKESGMSAMLPPEAAAKMKEAMDKMTPEQRKMMEEMMKKNGNQ